MDRNTITKILFGVICWRVLISMVWTGYSWSFVRYITKSECFGLCLYSVKWLDRISIFTVIFFGPTYYRADYQRYRKNCAYDNIWKYLASRSREPPPCRAPAPPRDEPVPKARFPGSRLLDPEKILPGTRCPDHLGRP